MKIVDRWNQIRAIVNDKDYVTVDELVERTNTSPATIRRDLLAMEKDGLLLRFRGGAKPLKKKEYETAFSIDKRLAEYQKEKISICKKAAEYIEDGDYIYIDTSSTTYFLPDFIKAKNVTVVTNSVLLLSKLLKNRISTYVLNGYIDMESGSILGEEAITRIKAMNFDKVFIGSYGVDVEKGFTTYGTAEGDLKKQLISQTRNAFVLVDSRKFGVSAFYTFGTLDSAMIITNNCLNEYKNRANIIQTAD